MILRMSYRQIHSQKHQKKTMKNGLQKIGKQKRRKNASLELLQMNKKMINIKIKRRNGKNIKNEENKREKIWI